MIGDRGFIEWRSQRRAREQIDTILKILGKYEDVLPLTLRRLFYISVAAEIIAKTNAAYRALGSPPALTCSRAGRRDDDTSC